MSLHRDIRCTCDLCGAEAMCASTEPCPPGWSYLVEKRPDDDEGIPHYAGEPQHLAALRSALREEAP